MMPRSRTANQNTSQRRGGRTAFALKNHDNTHPTVRPMRPFQVPGLRNAVTHLGGRDQRPVESCRASHIHTLSHLQSMFASGINALATTAPRPSPTCVPRPLGWGRSREREGRATESSGLPASGPSPSPRARVRASLVDQSSEASRQNELARVSVIHISGYAVG